MCRYCAQLHLHINLLSTGKKNRRTHTLSTSTQTPLKSLWHTVFSFPTVFAVKVDLHFPLLRPQQGLRHLSDGQSLGVRSIQEVARARLLHDLSARVTTHVAEAIVAEDDGAVLDSCIGYDELATCGWNEKSLLQLSRGQQHQNPIYGTEVSLRQRWQRNKLEMGKCLNTFQCVFQEKRIITVYPECNCIKLNTPQMLNIVRCKTLFSLLLYLHRATAMLPRDHFTVICDKQYFPDTNNALPWSLPKTVCQICVPLLHPNAYKCRYVRCATNRLLSRICLSHVPTRTYMYFITFIRLWICKTNPISLWLLQICSQRL